MFLAVVMHADRYGKCLHPLAIKARGETEQRGGEKNRGTGEKKK
jgi:hypothetical protein